MKHQHRFRESLSVIAAVGLLSGCASSHFDYTPPVSQATQTSFTKTINKPRDVVWASAVPALGKDFFVINNLDKASGLINVSYSGDPHAFVDCGHYSGFFSNAHGRQDYSFDGSAKDAAFITYIPPTASNVQRHMNLDGRINIIFESPTPETTIVTVNARYVLDKRSNIQTFTGQSGTAVDQIAFSSNTRGSFAPRSDGLAAECVATGKLEENILSLLH